MREFQLWAYDDYYPNAWERDWVGSFVTLAGAQAHAERLIRAAQRESRTPMDHYDITIFDAERDEFQLIHRVR